MNAWEGIGTTLVAALVSLAVSFAFRAWESHKVEWIVTGEAHDEYESGRATGRIRANVLFHSVGDGDAYGVISVRCNGTGYEPFGTFEQGKVASGSSVEIVMSVDPEKWDDAWVELLWESSPTGRSRTSRTGRRHLKDALWRTTGTPFRSNNERLRVQMKELPSGRRRRRGRARKTNQ